MNDAAPNTYNVAAFGVPDFERQVLERIFGISRSRTRAYQMSRPGAESTADIMLVDRDNAAAVAEYRRAREGSGPNAPVTVLVAREQPQNHPYHVRRPFMATRLLGVLDRAVESGAHAEKAPADAPPPAADTPAPRVPVPVPAEDCYRALVVDDSMAVRKQLALALERERVSVAFAENGEMALEMLTASAYDIVFLDVVMPGIDGYDVCKTIKRDRERKHVPVVMLTGRSSPFDRVRGKLSGCDTYLTKPVSRDDFFDTLKKYLKEPISQE